MGAVRLRDDNNFYSLCQIHFKELGFLFWAERVDFHFSYNSRPFTGYAQVLSMGSIGPQNHLSSFCNQARDHFIHSHKIPDFLRGDSMQQKWQMPWSHYSNII